MSEMILGEGTFYIFVKLKFSLTTRMRIAVPVGYSAHLVNQLLGFSKLQFHLHLITFGDFTKLLTLKKVVLTSNHTSYQLSAHQSYAMSQT